ncbi:hypothetical protein ElyMa_002723000 [Elysia marginata]|uniref:Uncharacterized protein n=1 Tax=Elysia marginata TaxID=1093978 RepID=A0AAV4HG14_9GAST|nr:hypothetical protein ElyMa_002723000 [Elysia marginata]
MADMAHHSAGVMDNVGTIVGQYRGQHPVGKVKHLGQITLSGIHPLRGRNAAGIPETRVRRPRKVAYQFVKWNGME